MPSQEQGGPYGAIIVKDNQLIAASGNKVTSTIDPTAHAEVMAIRLACKKLNDFQLHGLHTLLQLRTLPDVLRRHLLGEA